MESFDRLSDKSTSDTDYIYDPTGRVHDNVPCVECDRETTGKIRIKAQAFSEFKTLRLAFHDCVKYKDGSGGCDGCLNFDEDLEENTGLQFSAGILVSMILKEFQLCKRYCLKKVCNYRARRPASS